jgi:hypothetical protein
LASIADRAGIPVVARSSVVDVSAQASAIAQVIGTNVPIIRAKASGKLELTRSRAAVAVDCVAVIALLVGVQNTVAARGERRPAMGGREQEQATRDKQRDSRTLTRAGSVSIVAIWCASLPESLHRSPPVPPPVLGGRLRNREAC